MNKFKLTIEYDYDFTLVGISCHEKDYRIAWALNNKLKTELKKTEDLKIELKKNTSPTLFPFYEYIDEEAFREYFLIGNRGGKGMLIPEQKQVDYFLMIRGSYTDADKNNLLKQLKDINIVLAAYDIDANQLDSKQNLLF
jgi:hypothetical protein